MKLSVRNKLKGKIIAIEEGLITGSVKIDLGNGNQVVSIISKEAISELNLQLGDEAFAVIKSTDVIVGIPCGCSNSNCNCH